MTDHDPLCRWPIGPRSTTPEATHPSPSCDCGFIDKVRADERERTNTVGGHRQIREEGRADMCNDLRAKVEALIPPGEGLRAWDAGRREAIRDVLALIDGSSDG